MFFKKKSEGAGPIKYKRGKIKKNEYISKCLGYRFQIPEGVVMDDEATLEKQSTPNNILDMQGQLLPGFMVGVIFIPQEEKLPFINDEMIEYLASEGAKKINEMSTDGRKCTYLGICEFAGKKCTHSIIEMTVNGESYFSESYTHIQDYYQVLFMFNYPGRCSAEKLKAAFLPL